MLKFIEADASFSGEELELLPEQQQFVASREVIFAQAYLFRNYGSHCYIICDGETPVGIVLYYERPDEDIYQLSELFIDYRFQGKGYGTQAVEWVLEQMRKDGKYKIVYTFYFRANTAADKLYKKLGFHETCGNEDSIGVELDL